MRKYDTTFIVSGDLDQVEREAIIKRFQDVLEKQGAEIDRIVRWGMRTLAYEIKKKSRGYYVIFYYSAEPVVIKDAEKVLRINEHVLRYMTIRFDGEHPSYIPDEGDPDDAVAEAAVEAAIEIEAEEAAAELAAEQDAELALDEKPGESVDEPVNEPVEESAADDAADAEDAVQDAEQDVPADAPEDATTEDESATEDDVADESGDEEVK